MRFAFISFVFLCDMHNFVVFVVIVVVVVGGPCFGFFVLTEMRVYLYEHEDRMTVEKVTSSENGKRVEQASVETN